MRKLELEEITFTENESKSYVIYGFGILGRMLRKALSVLNISVDCFLCSDGYRKGEEVDGVRVYELSEYINNKDGIRKDGRLILVSTFLNLPQT